MRHLSTTTREAIVQGTLHLLSSKEFADVTTRAIARSAEVSEATIFRYFRSKRDILESIVSERARVLFAELEDVLPLVDHPRDKLLALCRRHATFAARSRDLIAVVQRQTAYLGPSSSACLQGLRRLLSLIRAILQDGIRRGAFRPDIDLDVATMAFHSVIAAIMLEDRVLRGRPRSEEAFVKQAERFYQMYLRAILAGEPPSHAPPGKKETP